VGEKDINVLDSNEDDSIVHSNMYQQRQRTTTAGSGVTDDLMQQLETSPNHDSNDLGMDRLHFRSLFACYLSQFLNCYLYDSFWMLVEPRCFS
jgi:hypothetical protein